LSPETIGLEISCAGEVSAAVTVWITGPEPFPLDPERPRAEDAADLRADLRAAFRLLATPSGTAYASSLTR
jgi:hypothetical protein